MHTVEVSAPIQSLSFSFFSMSPLAQHGIAPPWSTLLRLDAESDAVLVVACDLLDGVDALDSGRIIGSLARSSTEFGLNI